MKVLDPDEEKRAFSRRFLASIDDPSRYDALFDYLSDVYFFVKDSQGRFMRVNRAFLHLVRASEDVVIGARDCDFFPESLAESYARDDRQVLRFSQPIIDKAELVQNTDGSTDWFCTTKLPIFDKENRVIGVCGITRDVKKMNAHNAQFLSWAPVLETFINDYASPLQITALAEKLDLSVSQLRRRFRKRFATTPRAYLTNVRLNVACQFLVRTDLPIAEIAIRTGFHDQSHFTRRFTEGRGMPPSKYRSRYAQAGRPSSDHTNGHDAPATFLTVP
jgi:PAS domain S-box-containing protein